MDIQTRDQALSMLRHLLEPLWAYLELDDVQEVMVNGPESLWVEQAGGIYRIPGVLEPVALRSAILLLARLAERDLVGPEGGLVETQVLGLRATAALSPAAGPLDLLCLRRHRQQRMDLATLVDVGMLSFRQAAGLRGAIACGQNILLAGGTSSGKTTLLNALLGEVDPAERVISIEDSPEINPEIPHWVPLQSRPDGAGSLGALVRLALRLRPDRIVVGEVRGGEAADLLQATQTGHAGVLATVHAGSAREALHRLEVLALGARLGWPLEAIREQVGAGFQRVCFLVKVKGRRLLRESCELSGWEPVPGRYRLHDTGGQH